MGSGLDTGLWPMAGNMGQGAGRGFPDEAFGQRLSSTGADPGPSGERSVAGVGGVLGGPPWRVHRHLQSCGKGQTQGSKINFRGAARAHSALAQGGEGLKDDRLWQRKGTGVWQSLEI